MAKLQILQLHHLLLRLHTDVQHVVAADEGIAVLVFQLPVHILLSLLHRDVHVAV
eukprot:CAMPEP_0170593694 /NCGR_PEP_ID=MMETSP0224-20130122/13593_1 /TAXON_ID=285029 /ORGANISM="Togula jolla, Strain CCCM 725" /LENGTH=54 /DNA_ID=CAMNT_0010917681 /DNA_START=167 /DNA_END=331 /DNA_ORIENTATION=-